MSARAQGGLVSDADTSCAHGFIATNQQHLLTRSSIVFQVEEQFWNREIVVKIEYKYSPNLTIIDTPGTCHRACIARPLLQEYMALLSPSISLRATSNPPH